MTSPKLLDCTFRDGGYYNDWNFNPKVVSSYFTSLTTARIEAIEIGFRQPPQNRFVGPFGYSSDVYLETLNLPPTVKVAVMINAKDFIGGEGRQLVAQLFAPADASPVSFVRIAVHRSDLPKCGDLARQVRDLGYTVALNLMQVSLASECELAAAAAVVRDWQSVDVLYLADSVGSLLPETVRSRVEAVLDRWHGSVGIHTHNNKGYAVQNALAAVAAGATWVDGTIAGMGRGAGNAETEYLMLELNHQRGTAYCPEALFPLVMEEFQALRSSYGWGPNLLYYLSGMYDIHPTYVQEMLGPARHDAHDIIAALDVLRHSGASSSYSQERLQHAMRGQRGAATGTWSASGWSEGKPLLIVGSGPGTREHVGAICQFIERARPVVVCLNANQVFPVEHVTAYAACHRTRLLLDAEKYRNLHRPLIAPLAAVPDQVIPHLALVDVLDYGIDIDSDTFSVGVTGCTLPVSLVAAYVMAVAEAGSATRILLAGFDGYVDPSDPRRQEMAYALRCYQSRPEALPLVAVTPSNYDVPKSSIYCPSL